MINLPNTAAVLLFVTLCTLVLRDLLARRARRLKSLPPGPPGFPIIGNLLDIPSKLEWVTYSRWAKEYGKIVYLESMGQPILLVNSLDAATELFERRSSKHSDRPAMVMINEMLAFDWAFAFMPYGDRWRQHRKIFHLSYHPKAVERFFPAQQTAALHLARSLLESPEQYMDHIVFFGAYVILNITYGYRPKDKEDYYVQLNVLSQELLNNNGHQTYFVEYFPFLKKVPAWFPGAQFKRLSIKAHEVNKNMVNRPFELAKEDLIRGNPDPNFAQECLTKLEEKQDPSQIKDTEELIKNAAAIAYLAGGETTTTSIAYFFLAMLLYPETQKKAQLELDSLLEGKRLPEFSDMEHLPYIKAMVSEVMRWRPVTPLGVPHCSSVEDIYEGHHIPKGTILVGNVWAILHDEDTYGVDHLEFNPDRFLPKEGKAMPPDPSVAAFGFGRRVCPGRYLALNNLWITIATVLATFDLRKALDEQGNEIEPSLELISGIIVHPASFRCRFEPRSEAALRLLQAE